VGLRHGIYVCCHDRVILVKVIMYVVCALKLSTGSTMIIECFHDLLQGYIVILR